MILCLFFQVGHFVHTGHTGYSGTSCGDWVRCPWSAMLPALAIPISVPSCCPPADLVHRKPLLLADQEEWPTCPQSLEVLFQGCQIWKRGPDNGWALGKGSQPGWQHHSKEAWAAPEAGQESWHSLDKTNSPLLEKASQELMSLWH